MFLSLCEFYESSQFVIVYWRFGVACGFMESDGG